MKDVFIINTLNCNVLYFVQWPALSTLKLWKVWTQESFQKVEFDRPGERSPE